MEPVRRLGYRVMMPAFETFVTRLYSSYSSRLRASRSACCLSRVFGVPWTHRGEDFEGTQAVEVNGATLSYLERGQGEPVVFVHGSASDLRT